MDVILHAAKADGDYDEMRIKGVEVDVYDENMPVLAIIYSAKVITYKNNQLVSVTCVAWGRCESIIRG